MQFVVYVAVIFAVLSMALLKLLPIGSILMVFCGISFGTARSTFMTWVIIGQLAVSL